MKHFSYAGLAPISLLLTISFLASPARAQFDLPARQQSLVLSLGFPSLGIGWRQPVTTGQAWASLNYQLESQVLGLQLGHQWALLRSDGLGLDALVDFGPMAGIGFAPSLGARLGGTLAGRWQLGNWCLWAGPRLEGAMSSHGNGILDQRLDLGAVLALGWRGRPVSIWWRGESAYSLGGQGAGAINAGMSLVIQLALRGLL